jgi:hypothetical protein
MIDFEWRARQLSIWVGAAPEHEARLAKALRQLAADVLEEAASDVDAIRTRPGELSVLKSHAALMLRARATAIKDGKQ